MMIKGLVFFAFLGGFTASAIAQQPEVPVTIQAENDKRVQEIYEEYVQRLVGEIRNLETELDNLRTRNAAFGPEEIDAYRNYARSYYDQISQAREIRLNIFRWQITAGNWILGLVVFLTFSGVVFAGYQLYSAARLGQHISATELNISAQRVQVTSSAVGIIVLVISGIFLLLFLYEVYRIRPFAPEGATLATEHVGAPASLPGVSPQPE